MAITCEVLNTLVRARDGWRWEGHILRNGEVVRRVIGIAPLVGRGQIARHITEKMQEARAEYINQNRPVGKLELPIGGIFVGAWS